jgi:hypothetical protein
MPPLPSRSRYVVVALLLSALMSDDASAQRRNPAPNLTDWPQHSMERPRPLVVDPGPYLGPANVPSDAIVLFDGSGLAAWEKDGGGAPGWAVRDGYMEVVPGSGSIHTRQPFGDVQLHVEWASPNPPHGTGQDRGNSGVFLQGQYEVQIVDTYENETYADGMAGGLYGQYPPLVNPIRSPGEWNVYDIVFRAPRFNGDGTLATPARLTVFFNGVLVQDDQELIGPTSHGGRAPYRAHGNLGIGLQDHEHPVRFRNIWVREL